jgi:ABC-2 type transport system ATP-binding protein
MTPEALLTARGISRQFGAQVAVRSLDLELRRGEVLGLLGLNGAGKSTTLQILSGVLAPHTGRVTIGGHDLVRAPLAAKRLLGFLPEIPPLYVEARVDEYLRFCAELHAVPRAQIATAVTRSLQRCGLTEVSARLIRNLSKGYQQRVGIAQAIVHEPPVLILDEPTVGLDPAQIRDVRELIRALGREHAVLLSTHLLAEAESICSRVVILHQGRMVYDQVLNLAQRSLHVAFRAPPTITDLNRVPGISRVTGLAPGRFECVADDLGHAAEVLAETAVHHGWGLQELRPSDSTLERTFLDLTREHRDPVEAAA